jgi:hypothetical protein
MPAFRQEYQFIPKDSLDEKDNINCYFLYVNFV